MVGLVLDAPRQQVAALDDDRVAVLVEALGHDPLGAPAVVLEAGQREAALEALLLVVGQVKCRVDQMAELVVDEVGEDPQRNPELGCGQPDAGRVHHRVGQVPDQPAQLRVEVDDRFGLGPQDRVAEQADRLDRHGRLLVIMIGSDQVYGRADRVLVRRRVSFAGVRRVDRRT